MNYNSEKKYTYRCYKIKTPKDICIASRLTPKGNIIIAFMRSLTYDTDVKAFAVESDVGTTVESEGVHGVDAGLGFNGRTVEHTG